MLTLTVFRFRQLWFPRNQSQRQMNFPLWTKPLMTSQFLEDNTSLVCRILKLDFGIILMLIGIAPNTCFFCILAWRTRSDVAKPFCWSLEASPKAKSKKASSKSAKIKKEKSKCLKASNSGSGCMWKGYDLKALDLPKSAWPDPHKEHKGKHGYTVTCPTTNAVPQTMSIQKMCSLEKWYVLFIPTWNHCLGPKMNHFQVIHVKFYHTCKPLDMGMLL